MDWNEYFIKVAELTSQKSSCIRQKVGAVLVNDNRIISIGYNGLAPKKTPHCDVLFRKRYEDLYKNEFKNFQDYFDSKLFYDEHGEYSKLNEIHAEMNCLLFAAKNGLKTDGCKMYLTLSPCASCAKLMIPAGIVNVIYLEKYDRDSSGIQILNENNIICKQYEKIEAQQ